MLDEATPTRDNNAANQQKHQQKLWYFNEAQYLHATVTITEAAIRRISEKVAKCFVKVLPELFCLPVLFQAREAFRFVLLNEVQMNLVCLRGTACLAEVKKMLASHTVDASRKCPDSPEGFQSHHNLFAKCKNVADSESHINGKTCLERLFINLPYYWLSTSSD